MGIIYPRYTRNTRKSSQIPEFRFEWSATTCGAPVTAGGARLLTSRLARVLFRSVDGVLRLVFQTQPRSILPCLFKRHPPEPVAVRGESDQRILERWRQQELLQPFCPGEPPGKRSAATAGDLRLGFGPGNFPATPRAQRIDGEFRRFEGHGHSVAGDGRDHGDGVADAAIRARDRPVWPQRKAGDGTKRVFIKFSRSQPLVQR